MPRRLLVSQVENSPGPTQLRPRSTEHGNVYSATSVNEPQPLDIQQDVASLCATVAGADRGDPELRANVTATLGRLRALWRQRPDLFAGETIAQLREIARIFAGPP